jgi:hypothetical protein
MTSPVLHQVTPSQESNQAAQAHALGSYRHDVAYTAALKSAQTHALGSYRHDVAYTAALKSVQTSALGNYRHDVAYTAALKSSFAIHEELLFTGVEHCLAPVFFLGVFSLKGRVA